MRVAARCGSGIAVHCSSFSMSYIALGEECDKGAVDLEHGQRELPTGHQRSLDGGEMIVDGEVAHLSFLIPSHVQVPFGQCGRVAQ
jgi:hypothetical protein